MISCLHRVYCQQTFVSGTLYAVSARLVVLHAQPVSVVQLDVAHHGMTVVVPADDVDVTWPPASESYRRVDDAADHFVT